MYESYFHFTERPFAASPRTDRYYPGEAAETVRLTAARCVERAEGYTVILGASGTGKTLLCQVLAEQFRKSLAPVFLSGGQIGSRKALLQAILHELGIPYKRREEGELRLALLDRIADGRDKVEGLLVLVDEAQSLRPRLFEELRLLSNVVRQGKAGVRLVFAGTAALEEQIAHPKLAAFQQRVAVRCTLRAFSAAETQEYVRAQTAVVGGDPDVIWESDALLAIHAMTDGVPRLVNQVCDYALLLAAAGGVARIGARGIEEAWADLQQLPVASHSPTPASATVGETPTPSEAVIEFGSLDDELGESSGESLSLPNLEPVDPLQDADDEYLGVAASESQVELVFSSEQPGEDAAYDDYPIVTRSKAACEMNASDGEANGSDAVRAVAEGDVDDWVPVPIAQGAELMRSRTMPLHDPVLPETTPVFKIIPLREGVESPFASVPIVDDEESRNRDPLLPSGAYEVNDIVMEEEVPMPTYCCPDGRAVWPTPVEASPPRRTRSRRQPARPGRTGPRQFGQLFSKLQQS